MSADVDVAATSRFGIPNFPAPRAVLLGILEVSVSLGRSSSSSERVYWVILAKKDWLSWSMLGRERWYSLAKVWILLVGNLARILFLSM